MLLSLSKLAHFHCSCWQPCSSLSPPPVLTVLPKPNSEESGGGLRRIRRVRTSEDVYAEQTDAGRAGFVRTGKLGQPGIWQCVNKSSMWPLKKSSGAEPLLLKTARIEALLGLMKPSRRSPGVTLGLAPSAGDT